MKKVYKYSNYREYLRDYYEEMKRKVPGFSYRYFAEMASINAPATLLYIMEGKRNLSPKSVKQYIKALGLKKRESDYFETLVFYNQARTAKKKAKLLERLMRERRISNVFTVEKDRYAFYSKWYHSVVRELVNIFEIKQDFIKIGRLVTPPISPAKVRKSIELLERLGYIEREADGRYRQTHATIKTGPVQDHAILQFQTEMLKKALASFEKLAKGDKMSSSTTFSISKATFDRIKQKAREFRRELQEMAEADLNPERVYHLAITLFPVSREKKGRSK